MQWMDNSSPEVGEPLASPQPSHLLVASQDGWILYLQELTVAGEWSERESDLHINVLR